jgi:hypothetical protein
MGQEVELGQEAAHTPGAEALAGEGEEAEGIHFR